jgi:putative colanic acid biosysnthesis UDP-glucose lipid carrier transferase
LLATKQALAFALFLLEGRDLVARNVVLFGDHRYVNRMLQYVEKNRPRFMTITKIFEADMIGQHNLTDSISFNRMVDDVIHYFRHSSADDVIIALPWSAEQEILAAIDRLRELPTNVYLCADFVGFKQEIRPAPEHFSGVPMFEVVGRPLSGWDVIIKLVEDYVFSIIILVLLLPVLLTISIVIKLDSPGPVLFKQLRYGFNNELFNIYKFRTMRITGTSTTKTVQASPNDQRVTRVGRFLRRTSLDELPQLFNVLNSTMSLVGPRPHAVDHNEEYAQRIRGYFARHRMKPGMTGLAQVKGYRGVTDTIDKMENRVKYDIIYTDNWSPMLDIKILFKTVLVCLLGKNAY